MSDIFYSLSKDMVLSEGYKDATLSLFSSYVDGLIGDNSVLEKSVVAKLLRAAQILKKSGDEKSQKEGGVILSMLLDTHASKYPDLVPVANNVFLEAGNFPNMKLLSERHPDIRIENGYAYNAAEEFRINVNTVDDLDDPLTDFQRNLWGTLIKGDDVVTVAPTSAGKTYVILNYLVNKVYKSKGAFAAIVVPTRALISEVAANVYGILENIGGNGAVEVCTIYKDRDYSDKTIFVMTQERLHELLMRGGVVFDYLFVDEAHNISDKSRGVLLHVTVEKLMEDSLPQIIVGMPSQRYKDAFSEVFKGVDFKKEITCDSPVSKILISVVPKGRSLVLSRWGGDDKISVSKNFTGRKLADIVYRLGRGQGNIIYRNQTNHCEDVAKDISDRIKEHPEDALLDEAADYVASIIHPKFSLADNLRKGVAFHYGPLPGSARILIERLVKEGRINFVVCTSTLAEGVNLPAKNLFMKNPFTKIPMKPSERVDDVTMQNITGRAGRMVKHFSGNVFIVQHDEWQFQDYFEDEDENERRVPSLYDTLNGEVEKVIDALRGRLDHEDGDQYRFYTIANKLIREHSSGNLDNTMEAGDVLLTREQKQLLISEIRNAHKRLKVSSFTLEASPTIGYIQQNKLYLSLLDEESYESLLLIHPKSSGFYNRLVSVVTRLHEHGLYVPSEDYGVNYICLIASKWSRGKSLREIIEKQIEHHGESGKENKSVRDVIKVINNDARFRLANALRCYHVLLSEILLGKGLDLNSLPIHSFMEIGACDERMVMLINAGLSREAAKEVDNNLPKSIEISSVKDLMSLYDQGGLEELHGVTKKELLTVFR